VRCDMKIDRTIFGKIACGMSGCSKPATGNCEYCGLPLCEEHANKLTEVKREERFCRECFLFLSVTGRTKRPLARRVIPKVLVVDSGKCTGCRTCELVCSFRFKRAYSYSEGAIRIKKSEAICLNVPVLCEHCANPECVRVCPSEALWKEPETGMVLKLPERCIGCMKCVKACPNGAIFELPGRKDVVLCDLCQGDPLCATWCNTGALEWINKFEAGERKKLVLVKNKPTPF
jgi:carbon-monoxide dehydrogenase iron sulfur subunit